MHDVQLLGVLEATRDGPRIAYLQEAVPVTQELLSQTAPVPPTSIFRFAAQCEQTQCVHFSGDRCTLATRIVQLLPPVVQGLPGCLIRSKCRWFAQEGSQACVRCPQVVTDLADAPVEHQVVALPQDEG
jgi:hypothetical protein